MNQIDFTKHFIQQLQNTHSFHPHMEHSLEQTTKQISRNLKHLNYTMYLFYTQQNQVSTTKDALEIIQIHRA